MVAALYCLPQSVYHGVPGVGVWDKARDARRYGGPAPVVAHPPCAQWSRLRMFARVDEAERECGLIAVRQVREFGGVLEHPAGSALWDAAGLPAPGERDAFGGFTIGIEQREFGHPCDKKTLLYIVGIEPGSLPPLPLSLHYPTHVIDTSKRGTARRLKLLSKSARSKTPPALAAWLVQVAQLCAR